MQSRKPTIFFDDTLLAALHASIRGSPISKLHLSTRALNILDGLGVGSIGDLVDMARRGIPSPRAAGRKTAANIAGALHALAGSVIAGGVVDWLHYGAQLKLDAEHLDAHLLQMRPVNPRSVRINSPLLDALDAAVRRRSLKILHLRPRAFHALESVGISLIGELVDAARVGIAELPAAGRQTRVELREVLQALSKVVRPNGDIDLIQYAVHRNFRILPEKDCAKLSPRDFPKVFLGALQEAVKSRLGQSGSLVFAEYFFRHNSEPSSLRRVGENLGLTPQAIGLRKDNIVEMLRGTLLKDDYTGCRFRFRDVLVAPLRCLKERLNSAHGHTFRDSGWKQALADTWTIDPANLGALENLFRAILGLQIVHRSGRQFEPIMLPKSRGTAAFTAAQINIERLLRNQFPSGLSQSELLEQLQRSSETDLTLKEIPTLIQSIPGIEYFGCEKRFRLRVEKLTRLADQLERILDERGSPMHRRELTLEVGGFKRRAGSLRSAKHVVGAMSRDIRFKAIGRSGFWILAKWDIDTGDIADVAARCLSKSNRPLTEAELFPLIAARRPVKLNSIMSSLRDDGRFQRVAPRTWELKRASHGDF